ncbi:MAG TPA: CRISPR-associated helicase Cas3' [Sandaracinaceae bacterium LLY-WYZ-13_1]|nr:CRISPR-associated helicase Cas3' [Sandaracinaceae bacterium LLY-WYZ-13_1]
MSYATFFEDLTGHPPFPYQRRIGESERLPELLEAPTGAGKTAAIVIAWMWQRRFHPEQGLRQSTPRRLVYCLPMRVLVDQVHDEIQGWLHRAWPERPDERPLLQLLRGGQIDREWEAYPDRDAILVGTQDQLLSRALNRGYAMSRFLWPMHFALVHNDAWWVLDEVQLMGPGLTTGAQLEGLRRRLGAFGPFGSTFMSATLRPDWLRTPDLDGRRTHVQLADEDRGREPLADRLNASKPLARAPVTDEKKLATFIADEAHRPEHRTLVVVNRVKRAQAISKALRKALPGAEHVLLHGRFRPHERRGIEAALRKPPPSDGAIVVATQTVEAGVDLSAAAMVTDLAPWPSLVQRFGRCNRRGEHERAPIHWVDVETKKKGRSAPYAPEALDRARELLESLENARIADLPPVEEPAALVDVLRRRDLEGLFDTDPDLDGNFVDVSPFVRSADEADAQVFWRALDGRPPADLPGPRPDELCPVPIGSLRRLWEKRRRSVWRWDFLEGRWVGVHRASEGAAPGYLVPGETYLVDAAAGGYDPSLGLSPTSKKTVPEVPVEAASPLAAYGRDEHARRPYLSLAQHSVETRVEAEQLLESLGDLVDPETRAIVVRAAHWHDVGKAHDVFQRAIVGERPIEGPLAKAPSFAPYERKGFRHELASALVALEEGLSDLAAFLVAAHHGKVRMSLRPLSWSDAESASNGRLEIRGVADGDAIAAVRLDSETVTPALSVDLSLARLGRDSGRPSWAERAWRLLERWGPFRLAYLETLVRVADWRASARGEGTDDE